MHSHARPLCKCQKTQSAFYFRDLDFRGNLTVTYLFAGIFAASEPTDRQFLALDMVNNHCGDFHPADRRLLSPK